MTDDEIYLDVLDEEPSMDASKDAQKRFDKRLRKSIGWIDVEDVQWKRKDSNIIEHKLEYDVCTGDGGVAFEDESLASIFAEVVQINKRLKRLERNIKTRI